MNATVQLPDRVMGKDGEGYPRDYAVTHAEPVTHVLPRIGATLHRVTTCAFSLVFLVGRPGIEPGTP